MLSFIFFFQAEDGIRDYKVTGVQTCALPILRRLIFCALVLLPVCSVFAQRRRLPDRVPPKRSSQIESGFGINSDLPRDPRSEERRVGKSVDLGGRRIIKKKKKKNLSVTLDAN